MLLPNRESLCGCASGTEANTDADAAPAALPEAEPFSAPAEAPGSAAERAGLPGEAAGWPFMPFMPRAADS